MDAIVDDINFNRLPLPVVQFFTTDCGVACMTMATGLSYCSVQYIFQQLGLKKKSKIRGYTWKSNFQNLKIALQLVHWEATQKRFTSWADINTPAIIKVDNGSRYEWHWIYAFRTEELGLVVLDPLGLRYVEKIDALDNVPLSTWTPKGNWLSLRTVQERR